VLADSAGAEVEIWPSIGGSLGAYRSPLRDRPFDWLRPAVPGSLSPLDMAAFPLVPFSNRIREGRFSFAGEEVRLPLNFPPQRHAIHGQGWQSPWSIVEAQPQCATIEYRHCPGEWPFAYLARQAIELGSAGLDVTIALTNESERGMPAGLGLHPYHVATPECALRAEVSRMWATDAEVMPVERVDPPASLATSVGMRVGAVELDNGFAGWNGSARIEWPEHGAVLDIEADAPLEFLTIYTPGGEGVFCVEPVSHCTDAFNLAAAGCTGTGMAVLAPGETLAATIRFRPRSGKEP